MFNLFGYYITIGNGYFVEPSVLISLIIFCLIGYLLGSINFAIIFTKLFANTDVREHGSGNAGMTNVLRTAGKLPGILTFVFDFLKGTAAVLLAKYAVPILAGAIAEASWYGKIATSSLSYVATADSVLNPAVLMSIVGIFTLLGHMFPIFFKFRGGKGVATIAGIIGVISPYAMLIALATFLVLTLTTKIVSSSSIVGVTLATVLAYVFYGDATSYIWFGGNQRIIVTVLVGVMALMIILKHHENIVRLIHGNENKLGKKG